MHAVGRHNHARTAVFALRLRKIAPPPCGAQARPDDGSNFGLDLVPRRTHPRPPLRLVTLGVAQHRQETESYPSARDLLHIRRELEVFPAQLSANVVRLILSRFACSRTGTRQLRFSCSAFYYIHACLMIQ